jgi:capsular polysaccharide biosynthesis protein
MEFDMRSLGSSDSNLYDTLVNQRLVVVIVIAVGFIIAGLIFLFSKPQYSATATILMVADSSALPGPQASVTGTKPLLAQDLPTLVTSDTVLTRIRKDIGENISLITLSSRIRARVANYSNVMPVQYTDTTPDAAIAGANAIADEVEGFYGELATKRFDSLIADLKRQESEHAQRLARLDGELQAAAQQYPYDDVSPTVQQSVYQRLVALRSETDELRSSIAAERSAVDGTEALISDAEAPAMRDIVENDSVYRNLYDQYSRDFAQLSHLESHWTASYAGLRELRATVARERADLVSVRTRAAAAGLGANLTYAAARDAVAKAETVLQSDTSKLAVLDAQSQDLNGQISKGGIAARVAAIRRERDNEQTAYAMFAARLSTATADRADAASTGSVEVIDRASFAKRVLWTTSTYVAIMVASLTLWAAVSLALLLERKKERFKDSEVEIRDIYEAPLLGSIL